MIRPVLLLHANLRCAPLAVVITNVVITTVAITTFAIAISVASFTTPIAQARAATAYSSLKKYSDTWDMLRDPLVKKGIAEVMGNKTEEYWSRTQIVDDSGTSGDQIFVEGGIRGIYPYSNSLLYIDMASGKLCAGYSDDKIIHLFGAHQAVPKPISEYADKHAHKKIVLEATDRTPLAAGAKARERVTSTKLTGTYERTISRFQDATLLVQELPDGKLRFQVWANNGANTGQASGIVKIASGLAVYKNEGGTIQFKFAPGKIFLSGDDSYFCGNAVTLGGTYGKTSDKTSQWQAKFE